MTVIYPIHRGDVHMADSPLIGRKREFETLVKYLEMAKDGKGQAMLLMGDPGMGKSTLVKGVAEEHQEVMFAYYVCKREEIHKPFRPVIALLDSIKSRYAKAGSYAAQLKNSLEERKEQGGPLKETLTFFKNVSKHGALFLFIDNIHLADRDTIRLLREISTHLNELKLHLVMSLPSGEAQEGEGSPLVELLGTLLVRDKMVTMKLGSMEREEIEDHLKQLLQVKNIPEEFLNGVYDQTAGNPFFVKELMNNLVSCGDLVIGDESSLIVFNWDEVCVPDSIDDIIENRLLELPDEDLNTLKAISIWGMEFSLQAAADILEVPLEDALDKAEKLMTAGLIKKTDSQGDIYKFEHSKMHEWIYQSLGNQRRDMHLKAARILENRNEDSADAIFNLAYHYSRSRDIEKAILFAIMAAKRAMRSNAPRSALKFAETAMRLLEGAEVTGESITQFMETEELMADLYFTLGRWDESLERYNTLLEASIQQNDAVAEARANLGLSEVYRNKGDWQRAHEYGLIAMNKSQSSNYQRGFAMALRNLGYVNWRLGNYDKAQEYYNSCIAAAAQIKDMETMGIIYIEIGNLTSVRGKLDEAMKIYSKSIKILETNKNFRELARAYNNLGDVYLQKKEWANALTHFEKSKRYADRMGDKNMAAWADLNAGEAHANLGNLENAIENCKRALDILKETGDKSGISGVHKTLGMAYALSDDWDSAMSHFNISIDINKETKTPDTLADTYYVIGDLLMKEGNEDDANYYLKMGLDISEKIGASKISERIRAVMK
ncbi:MAG TPA: tetratricopeptide repeat protein [Euryarchaeota archaeon]|nr:tetratricopeptide repeat protein [Euryarchaeota archaeon]